MDEPNRADSTRRPVRPLLWLGLAALLAGPVPFVLLRDARWVSPLLHSSLETVCALTSIILAYVLAALPSSRLARVPFTIPLGFLAMGVLDSFHTFAHEGSGFVLLRSFASLAVGLGFACLDLAPRPRRWLAWVTLLASLALSALVVLGRDLLPTCHVDGVFTPFATGLNALAGVLCLVGALRLRAGASATAPDERRWLVGIACVLGLSSLCFPLSTVWDGPWWCWHLYRLCAGGLILAYLVQKSRTTWSALARANRALGMIRECNEKLVRAESEESLLSDICGVAVATGAYRDARVDLDAAGPAPSEDPSLLQLPLGFRGRTLGTLSIRAQDGEGFDAVERRLLAALARDLAFGIATLRARGEQARTEEHLRHSQKIEALGRLAGAVAHDFNNLLMVTLGFGDLALGHAKPGSPLEGYLEQIQATTRRGAALAGQLLAFSRRQVARPRVLDLGAVVAGMEPMIRRLGGEDLEVVILRGSGLGHVKADPGHLEQVVMNLVVNARDAMVGGGTITIETQDFDLDRDDLLRGEEVRAGRYVRLVVSDTGSGMGPDVLARLFEPFFTTKELGKGTGLGLSTVDGIVRQGGGHVRVRSAPGKGTTFEVCLPRVEEELEVVEEPVAAAAPSESAGGETILVVEDSEDLRMMMCEGLGMHGYRVLEAGHAAEALRLLEDPAAQIDLLMSDVVLPGGVTGFDLARRTIALRPHARVLLLTGYTDHPAMSDTALMERIAILQKPVALAPLAQRVRQILVAPAPGQLAASSGTLGA